MRKYLSMKDWKNKEENLTGKHGIKRQKAIINNNKIYKKIADMRIEHAKAHINMILSKEIRQVAKNNPKRLQKILNKMKQNYKG